MYCRRLRYYGVLFILNKLTVDTNWCTKLPNTKAISLISLKVFVILLRLK